MFFFFFIFFLVVTPLLSRQFLGNYYRHQHKYYTAGTAMTRRLNFCEIG